MGMVDAFVMKNEASRDSTAHRCRCSTECHKLPPIVVVFSAFVLHAEQSPAERDHTLTDELTTIFSVLEAFGVEFPAQLTLQQSADTYV